MDQKFRKRKRKFFFGRQCRFQIMGHRCQLESDVCSWRHKIKSRYCEFHGREERENECELLTDF